MQEPSVEKPGESRAWRPRADLEVRPTGLAGLDSGRVVAISRRAADGHHFPGMLFYRLDPDLRKLDPNLEDPIEMDDVESVDPLRKYGEQFAGTVDWQAILDGSDTMFRVTERKTLWVQYKRP